MARQHVEVEGADTFARTNARVARELGDLSKINGLIARQVATRASTYAPKATGRLAYSIRGEGLPGEARISTNVGIYAGVQEFGWPGHHIEAVRYMGRASRDYQPAAIQAHRAHTNLLLSTVKGA